MTIVSFALPESAPLRIEDPHIDSIDDPVGREVALRLKVAHLQKELVNRGIPDPTSFLEPSRGYQQQVAELHRAVEMERRLRYNTEAMLRETQKAVETLSSKQAQHDRTMNLYNKTLSSTSTSSPPPLPPLTVPAFRSQISLPTLPLSPTSQSGPASPIGSVSTSSSFKGDSTLGSGNGQTSNKPTRRPTLGATLKIKPTPPPPAPKISSRRGRSLDRS